MPPAPEPIDSEERDLGLDVPITRRDFLNSTLLASGALLLDAKAPLLAQAPSASNAAWEGFGGVGDYARSHGNMWATVSTAHDLRDGKLGDDAARRRAVDTGERYDLIVVGGGLSGLGAAAFFQKLKGGECWCSITGNGAIVRRLVMPSGVVIPSERSESRNRDWVDRGLSTRTIAIPRLRAFGPPLGMTTRSA